MARRFNPLLDDLPTEVVVGERTYTVKTDFRVVLSFLRLEGDDSERTILALRLFFGDEIYREDVDELLKYIKWYINRGEEEKKEKKTAKRAPVFDMEVDSGRILAAFFQVYRINLRTASMHWWTFCELLEALPETTHLAEVVRIRSRKITKDMTPSERNELQRAKERYAIGEQVDPMTKMLNSLKGIT